MVCVLTELEPSSGNRLVPASGKAFIKVQIYKLINEEMLKTDAQRLRLRL